MDDVEWTGMEKNSVEWSAGFSEDAQNRVNFSMNLTNEGERFWRFWAYCAGVGEKLLFLKKLFTKRCKFSIIKTNEEEGQMHGREDLLLYGTSVYSARPYGAVVQSP